MIVADTSRLRHPLTGKTPETSGVLSGERPDGGLSRMAHDELAMSDFVTEFKSLRRPREGRLIFGVCRGLAERFGTEVLAIRIGVVLAAAVIDYVPLAYIVGVLFIPSMPKSELSAKTKGRLRQLALFALLAGVSDAVIDDSLPSSKAFAVLLVLAGIAMMNMRNRSLRQRSGPPGGDAANAVGGWVSPAAQLKDDLPPRWGLAGETVNPHVWNPGDPIAPGTRSKWQSQFGNLALVTLVAVLGIGIWTNTSNKSPLRQAALKERLDRGPVSISTAGELRELELTNLGNGEFVIDMSTFDLSDLGDEQPRLDITMGSGRLDVIVQPGTKVTGTVLAARSDDVFVLRTPAKPTVDPEKFSEIIGNSSTTSSNAQTLAISVKISHGLVCIRALADAPCT